MATPATTTAPAEDRATAGAGSRARKAKPPPGTLILFVRHGVTPTTGQVLPGRAPGLHLADKGRAEAEAVAERLAELTSAPPGANGKKPFSIAAVYTSPMERARETAAPIARHLGQKTSIVRGLVEMDFGEWTGAELKALRKLPEWEAVQRHPSGFRFPAGESFSDLRSRIADSVDALCRRHPGEAIVAVSHADPIKVAVSDALGSHLDLFQRIVVSTCSVTAIRYHSTGPLVLAVNSNGALRDLVGP